MIPKFKNAWGYQGDAMNLPVANVESSLTFYENVMGFRIADRGDPPQSSAILERDGVQMRLAENGGDPSQDGCAFEVENLEALHSEYAGRIGLPVTSPDDDVAGSGRGGAEGFAGASVSPEIKTENRADGTSWRVFFVTAPDGLCYWFGERQTN